MQPDQHNEAMQREWASLLSRTRQRLGTNLTDAELQLLLQYMTHYRMLCRVSNTLLDTPELLSLADLLRDNMDDVWRRIQQHAGLVALLAELTWADAAWLEQHPDVQAHFLQQLLYGFAAAENLPAGLRGPHGPSGQPQEVIQVS